MPKRLHSTLILVAVFGLGLAAGIGGMVWAWPGLRARYSPPRRHENFTQFLTRTLQLNPQQQDQVRAVAKETQDRRDQVHQQFVPQYTKVCEDFTTAVKQERDAFAPIRQQELDKLHSIFTGTQWQTFQQQRAQAARNQPQRQTDLCRRLSSGPGGRGPGGRGPHGPGGGGPHPPGRF